MPMTAEQAFQKAYGASKKYIDDSLIGVGALKGAPCQIESITPTSTGKVVTFKWVDDNGESHTSTLFVENGEKGDPGDKGDQGIPGYPPQVEVNTETESTYKLDITYKDEDTGEEVTITTPNLKGSGSGGDEPLTPEQLESLIDILV